MNPNQITAYIPESKAARAESRKRLVKQFIARGHSRATAIKLAKAVR